MLPHQPFFHRSLSTRALALLMGLSVWCLAPVASAQWRTMDRQQDGTRADAQFNFVIPNADDATTLVRTDLYGQIGWRQFGVYGSVPLTRTVDLADPVRALGNVEVGLLHAAPLHRRVGVTTHLGLIVPTASRSDRAVTTNAAGSVARVNDAFTGSDPDIYTVRAATSPHLDLGRFFVRSDLGFDFAVPRDERSREVYLRANVGVGARVWRATMTAEVANAGLLTDRGSASSRYLHTGSLGVRFQLPVLQPYAAFTTPLDAGLRGDVYVLSIGATVGL